MSLVNQKNLFGPSRLRALVRLRLLYTLIPYYKVQSIPHFVRNGWQDDPGHARHPLPSSISISYGFIMIIYLNWWFQSAYYVV